MNTKTCTLSVMGTMLAVGFASRAALAGTLQGTNSPLVRTHTVRKKVSDFPTEENLFTPEAAYAFFI